MKSVIATLVVLFFAIQLNAQETVTPEKGVLTLDFSIERNFDLDAASGASLSMRRWLSEKSALSIGISLSADDQDGAYHLDDNILDSLIVNDTDSANNGFALKLEALLQKVVRGHNPMLILGGGPYIDISNSKRESDYQNRRASAYTSETRSTKLGLTGQISGEWFVKKYISLSASYRPAFYWFDTQNDTYSYDDSQLDRSEHNEDQGWRIQTGNVRLGLSIWFE